MSLIHNVVCCVTLPPEIVLYSGRAAGQQGCVVLMEIVVNGDALTLSVWASI